jgi:hypothetical protein
VLRDYLVEHRMTQGRSMGLVFGRSEVRPFNISTAWSRARRAWEAAELNPITLH